MNTPISTNPKKINRFDEEIKSEVDKGLGLIPFVGSGISANSGILMSKEFDNYLAYCIWKVLGSPKILKEKSDSEHNTATTGNAGIEQKETTPSAPERYPDEHFESGTNKPWNIKKMGWPPFPQEEDLEHTRIYIRACLNENLRIVAGTVSPRKSNDPGVESQTYPLKPEDEHTKVVDILSSYRPMIEKSDQVEGIGIHERKIMKDPVTFDLRRAIVPNIIPQETNFGAAEEKLYRDKIASGIENVPWGLQNSTTSQRYIRQSALHSLSHWTTALEFMSQTRVTRYGRLYLADPDSSIIDDFNQHIIRDKHPNFIHNMLARLTRSLRSRLILTTNFDNLLEKAFRAQGEPLRTIAVSHKGGMPPYSSVRSQDCLVKLHGDIMETRADSSIHKPASTSDKKHFYQYLFGPNLPTAKQLESFTRNHLLVLGYSARDNRCVDMIKHALDSSQELRVFWVCHTESDKAHVESIFDEYIDKKTPDSKLQIQILVTNRTDLLLWELYQLLNLSLPGGGYSFRFSHNVPPVHYTDFNGDSMMRENDSLMSNLKDLSTKISDKIKQNSFHKFDRDTGTSETFKYHYYQVAGRKNTIWLELEDYTDPTILVWDILMTMSIRKGAFRGEAINVLPESYLTLHSRYNGWFKHKANEKDFLNDLMTKSRITMEKFGATPKDWCVFLYGRNGLGGCSNLETTEISEVIDRWDPSRYEREKNLANYTKARPIVSSRKYLTGTTPIGINTRKLNFSRKRSENYQRLE
ncbi:SIR2 family protein [Rubellicoccus peritrichatus]|uniref:SIR2 family protein n=1 Tax=Rubellicoccus peritrichatus TaxID=3080537 RepID=A0AAQ3L728_9BACT|nr:SIR2 family protein [Puniceicoccus sp. CR14]WOO40241.1 SIR2 family protein [Puniceicoccus sp. CR14]